MRQHRAVVRTLIASALALSLGAAPVVVAADRFIPMDRATVRQVVHDLGRQQPARCYRGRLAQSDPTWGSIGGRNGETD